MDCAVEAGVGVVVGGSDVSPEHKVLWASTATSTAAPTYDDRSRQGLDLGAVPTKPPSPSSVTLMAASAADTSPPRPARASSPTPPVTTAGEERF